MQISDNSTTAVSPPPPVRGRQRSRLLQFATFLSSLVWYFCSRVWADRAGNGIAQRFDLGDEQSLLSACFLVILLVCGFALLRGMERRRAPLRLTLGLPRRRTFREEWATGAAIGWGIAALSVLPVALARHLNVEVWTAPRAFELLALSLATLAVSTLTYALGFFGYGFHRLIEATGPVRATLLLVTFAAIHAGFVQTPYGTPDGVRILVEMLGTLLLCLCWFRTHGLWLGWGLQFGWAASISLLFGLPLCGDPSLSSVVDTRAGGPLWLTGGVFGPAASMSSMLLMLAAIPVLVGITRDYAWDYTHPPLIPAGYDVTIPPPAAHVAMEQTALAAPPVNPASLVQILPAAPQNSAAHKPRD